MERITLSVFEPTLSKIVEGISGESLGLKLLMAPRFLFRVNQRDVVFSVQTVAGK